MYEFGFYISTDDLQLLLARFDKDRDGKISMKDVRIIL
jgi:Ca2+-binding EF-hand superfamily protein